MAQKTPAELKGVFIKDYKPKQADFADVFESFLPTIGFEQTIAPSTSIPFTHRFTQLETLYITSNSAIVPVTVDALPGARTSLVVVADGVHTLDYSAFTVVEGSEYVNDEAKRHFFEFYYTGANYILRVTPLAVAVEVQPEIPFLALDFEGKDILFYGDSITYGYGVTTGYPVTLCAAKGGVCINHGISGQVLEGVSFEGRAIFDKTTIPVKGANHKYLFLNLGVNDMDRATGGFTVAGFKAKLLEVVDYAISVRGWSGRSIVLMTPFYITDAHATYTLKESYAAAVREVAFSLKTVLIDVYLYMRDYAAINSYIADGLHPNQAMHDIIAGFLGFVDYRTEHQKTFRTNWALSSNGATPSVNATLGLNVPADAIDGCRNTNGKWDSAESPGGGWFPGNVALPHWFQVDFVGTKSISEINTIALQEVVNTTVDPTLSTLSTTFNNVDYKIEYWNSGTSSWVEIANVTGNNKCWRKHVFAPIVTGKIRQTITALGSSSYKSACLVEFEAIGD